jgi:hypothetical protein
MKTRKRGAIALIDSVAGLALLFIDIWGRISQVSGLSLWLWLRPWQPYLPAAYGANFVIALFLLRAEYESADYELGLDPATEHLREVDEDGMGCADTYRVCVMNTGHTTIAAQVRVQNITPMPPELRSKLGMPLIPMGEETDTKAVEISPNDRKSFNVVSLISRFSGQCDSDGADIFEDYLHLWHNWSGAPKEIGAGEYEFELALTPIDGVPTVERFRFIREAEPLKTGRMFRLDRVAKTGFASRVLRRTSPPHLVT